jgi:polysaccharide biosynthesis/export protein
MRRKILEKVALVLAVILISGPRSLPQEPAEDGSAETVTGPAAPNNPKISPEVTALRNTPTIGSDYVIGPEDVLRVDVFDVPESSNLNLREANDGTIAPPLLGHVQVAGLSPSQVRRELESRRGGELPAETRGQRVCPGISCPTGLHRGSGREARLYQLTGPRSLIEMLSLAGGLAKRSSAPAGGSVCVTRRGGFQNLQPVDGMRQLAPDKVEIELPKLLSSKGDALSIAIHPSDIISVSKADIVSVTGRGVTKPAGYVLEDRDNVTVFQALAMAEGLTANAAKHDARIIRQNPDGSKLEIPVDIDRVTKGKAPDPVLTANDILFVPNSVQKAGLKRAVDSTIATVSGFLNFGCFRYPDNREVSERDA